MIDSQRWEGKRVLVTGASGFLGGHLCRRLVDLGVDLVAVSRRPPSMEGNAFNWRQCDLADWAETERLVTSIRPEIVFHLAGYADAHREIEHVLPALHGNLTATVHLLTVLSQLSCERIVLCGTFETPISGELPTSPYAASKASAAIFAQLFKERYGLPLVTARIFMAYGPDQPRQKLIPYVIRSLLAGRSPQLGDGARAVDWVYVNDVVAGLMQLALTPDIEGRTLDLGSGHSLTIRRLVEQVAALVDPTVPLHFDALPSRGPEVVRVADVRATTDATGWCATTTLDHGLRRTVDALREQVVHWQSQPTAP